MAKEPGMTVPQLVDLLHEQAIARGMDCSPSDIGWLLAEFIETMFTGEPLPLPVTKYGQWVADECARVRDE